MARQHYYYEILRKTIVQVLDLFKDVTIARYNDQGIITKYIKVPLLFAPKTKQWYWEERRKEKVLPMMALNMTSAEYDQNRSTNQHSRIRVSRDGGNIEEYKNPTPYNFSFQLQIAAEYMIDIVQIIEQILPYFQPYVVVRITVDELGIGIPDATDSHGTEPLEIKVHYEGNDIDAPVEIDEANYRMLMWTLNFKANGYLFQRKSTVEEIRKITMKWYTSEDQYKLSVSSDEFTETVSATVCDVVDKLYYKDLESIPYSGSCSGINPFYIVVKEDVRTTKTDTPEITDTGISGYDRNPKDLSNHLLKWEDNIWYDMGVVENINTIKAGDVVTTVVNETSSLGDLKIGLADKIDYFEGSYDENAHQIIQWEEAYATD